MARDHMGVPATSAASERVFSNGGDIITKRRNNLSGNNTRYLERLGNIIRDEDSDSEDGYNELKTPELEEYHKLLL
jgi:hAT family protein